MAPRVLIVDDDRETRSLLQRLLQEEGLDVVGEAGDGREALRLAAELSPDVVLMDLSMPEMSGIEATRLLRQAMPGVEVVILSTHDGPHPIRCAEQAGTFAYLVKGCPVHLIVDTVRKAGEHRTATGLPPGDGSGAEPAPSVTMDFFPA